MDEADHDQGDPPDRDRAADGERHHQHHDLAGGPTSDRSRTLLGAHGRLRAYGTHSRTITMMIPIRMIQWNVWSDKEPTSPHVQPETNDGRCSLAWTHGTDQ